MLPRGGAATRVGGTFALRPRGRVAGRPLGSLPGVRRGGRFDPVSSRPYQPGDDPRLIDQRTSARIATARGSDDLIVREHLAELSPRVLVVRDRTATMELYPAGLPWLHEPAAVEAVVALVTASAWRARSRIAVADGVSLRDVLADRWLRRGAFVFVVSDFLQPLDDGAWLEGRARGVDLVPVIVQDPVWERSFPDLAGVPLALADPVTGRAGTARLRPAEAQRRREANEARFRALLERFAALDVDPVVVERADADDVRRRFVSWSAARARGGAPC